VGQDEVPLEPKRLLGEGRRLQDAREHLADGPSAGGRVRRRLEPGLDEVPLEPEGVLGPVQTGLEGLGPARGAQVAGVFSLRDDGQQDADVVGEEEFHRPVGGPLARQVAVEDHDDLVGVAFQGPDVVVGQGGAQRRHTPADAHLVGHQHVEVTLDHDGLAAGLDGLAGLRQAVEGLFFVKERGFGRVQVFRLLGAERPPAETDRPAQRVQDREDHPSAEPVVVAGAVGATDGQARPLERLGPDAFPLGRLKQVVPSFGGVAQAEGLDRLLGDSPARQILPAGPALVRVGQPGLEPPHRPGDHLAEAAAPRGAPAGFGVFPQFDAGPLGQHPNGLGERHVLLGHYEVEHAPAAPAPEALENLLRGADGEGGRLLGVERAQRHIVLPRLFQGEVGGDDLNNVVGACDPL